MRFTKKITAVLLTLVMVLMLPVVPAYASQRGYSFSDNGARTYIGAKAGGFIKRQGTPVSKTGPEASCYEDNTYDYVYEFDDFKICTISKGKKDVQYVNRIIFTSAKAKTDKGIHIGSTVKQMKKKYGNKKQSFDAYVYKKGNMSITFTAEHGKITDIEYSKE